MVATKSITIAEFEAMPLEGRWELIDGELAEMTPVSFRSVWIAGEIFGRIRDHVRTNQPGWAVGDGAGFVLFDDRATVRSPDAAFIRRERLPRLTNHFVPVAPDLAVEVLSPSDRMADALAKVAEYLQAGVELVWLGDPANRTITVFRPDDSITVLHSDNVLEGGDVLPGFFTPIAEIFAED